ncbi:hypothetical protein GNI_026800 [Gregarina niphandrodes]|uniref:Uncharacterized protein n=1 Tax=Gregarina niphandrodes TaxID=110365 RepID=A0A023BBA1_GRENI|nr:hypothetical protein GNI_026800 [Gregarina niphandrodes]EZG79370.1 hypothetical protein GNI_026800 [Gregarina niphandrodes]|eukprot:XP_011129058.1 hypothetical protein GNI_026800 [Gregarina niphandrodes]
MLPIRPDDGDDTVPIVCAEPPNTDWQYSRYEESDVETAMTIDGEWILAAGKKPNPEAIPICSKWLSTRSSEITSSSCINLCRSLATTQCLEVRQNWVYGRWLSTTVDLGGGGSSPNGLFDCVHSKLIGSERYCTGPCKNQGNVEVSCLLERGYCYNHDDPRNLYDTTTPAPETTSFTTSTTTSPNETTSEAYVDVTWELGIIGGAMASGAGIAAVAGTCCYCTRTAAQAATEGIQDFTAQVGDGLDDAELMLRRQKFTKDIVKDDHTILREELALRAHRSKTRKRQRKRQRNPPSSNEPSSNEDNDEPATP